MAAKKTYLNFILPVGTAAFAHVYKPDDKAPDGASWKPDGKFKITTIYDTDEVLEEIRASLVKFMMGVYPNTPADTFLLPITQVPGDDKKADLRGKFLVIAKTKNMVEAKNLVDSRGKPLPASVLIKSGDLVRVKVSASSWDKTEKVKIKEGNKVREVDEQVFGCNLYLNGIQLIEKRAGGDNGWGDAVEGGYESPAEANDTRKEAAGAPVDDGNGDF